jgi:selenophosphate synthetase-related protein
MLKKVAQSIRNNENIIEKKELSPIVEYITSNSFKKETKIFSDIGEDSAAIKNNDKYTLITTDRIKTSFVENFPFGAGFSSILVGVDDIYCCGGTPLAASIILSFSDRNIGQKIIEGICEGSNKFNVPIIRGHTNTSSKCYELSSTMIGEINKEDYISAKTAQIDDNIILVVDFNGRVGKASKFYYDTTTYKESGEVLRARKAMNVIAKKHLVNASKDVSNGGIFGTLLQLINYSNVGANVNIKDIIIPPVLKNLKYTLEIYIQMYLTTSYILTASDEKCDQLIKIFKEYGLNANVIGKIIKEQHLLKINDGNESLDVIKI